MIRGSDAHIDILLRSMTLDGCLFDIHTTENREHPLSGAGPSTRQHAERRKEKNVFISAVLERKGQPC